MAGAPQDGSGADGLDSTLLPADLNQTSRQDVQRMLRGAGVPFIDSDSIAVVCSKLAAATWAAEQLRKLQYSTATHAGPGDRGGMDSDSTTRSGHRLDPLRLSRVPLGARSGIDGDSTRYIVLVHRLVIFRAAEAVTAPAGASAPCMSVNTSADEADSDRLRPGAERHGL